MSWTPLAPPVLSAGAVAALPVTMTVNPSGNSSGRQRQRAMLIVRPRLLPAALPFWRPGAAVSVLVGANEHAGTVRIVPGHGHILHKIMGSNKASDTSAALPLHGLSGMPALGMKSRALEYDFSDDWLEVTLPAWDQPAKPQPAAAPLPATPAMPFKGVATREGLAPNTGRPSRPAGM